MKLFLCLLLITLSLPCTQARADTLRLELAENRVDITTGFNGTRVVLFGTVDRPDADIAVTLKGPEKTVIVRRKGRVLGAWMNHASQEFRRVLSYYDYATTRPEGIIGSPDLLQDNHIGIDHLDYYAEGDDRSPAELAAFSGALVETMQQKGLYPLRASVVRYVQPQFFKVVFNLPPGVPTGLYTVEGMMIGDGKVVSRETRTLRVGQVGFNARVYSVAMDSSFLYAVAAIVLAFFSGWAAFTFLRRD